MEILSGLDALPDPRLRGPVVTWGVFDGVHVGHRRVLETLVGWARAEGVPSVVVTFDRHPMEVLQGVSVPLISPLAERLRLLGEKGVDAGLVLNFTKEFAKTTADAFIRDVVAGRLRAKGVVLGHDSRFGKDREGDLATLETLSRDLGLAVKRCEPELFEGRPVSSSLIRELILGGRLAEARRLLGRPPSVIGTVVRGDRRGAAIGVPTANLELHHAAKPPGGVYAADVPLDGRLFRAVVNIGTRPTFKEGDVETIEAHLLDYAGGDLYGRVLEVRFLERLRDEKRFDGVDALKKQIAEDIRVARTTNQES
ncbi:MAG TPA: riboflavin biosynthesis protein RibF [Planctomycetota bacterium]